MTEPLLVHYVVYCIVNPQSPRDRRIVREGCSLVSNSQVVIDSFA